MGTAICSDHAKLSYHGLQQNMQSITFTEQSCQNPPVQLGIKTNDFFNIQVFQYFCLARVIETLEVSSVFSSCSQYYHLSSIMKYSCEFSCLWILSYIWICGMFSWHHKLHICHWRLKIVIVQTSKKTLNRKNRRLRKWFQNRSDNSKMHDSIVSYASPTVMHHWQ